MASRNVFFFFELLFWPIVGVISIGLMTRFLGITPAQASFVLIGTIALSVVNVCQLEVAYAVLMDAWSKSIKHQFLAPIGIRHLTVGSWLVCLSYPGSLLPAPAAALARAIPLTYFLDAYRSHFGFASEFATPIATGLALSVVYAVVAPLAFYAAVQRARRTGLLLKMSE